MKKIKEISISDYKLLSSVMIDRHYYFDIKVLYEDNSDQKLNKRYSEIEELYKILILKYPGCRIPSFPKKTFLMNIHINVEEKKEIIINIEKFLRHIINHKILCEKKIVNEFFANLSINKNQTLKTNMMKISEDDDINSSEFNVNENINKDEKNNDKEEQKEEKENDIANDFEIIEFKKTENYDMWIEKNLLNIFIEEENSEKIPNPTDLNKIEFPKDGTTALVIIQADTLEYRKSHDTKTIRKNVSIPSWLNQLAIKKNINFSNMLQNALKQELKIE